MRSSSKSFQSPRPRRGLAPVELILALPVWMLLASAMVLVGHLGAWKIRGHLAAREAAARTQWPRMRNADPNPLEWSPRSAILQSRPEPPLLFNDPLDGHAVIRGPQLGVPGSDVVLLVNPQAMVTRSDSRVGEAFLNEPPAIWSRSGIRNRFAREYSILDGANGQWSARSGATLRSQQVWSLPPLD